MRSRAKTRPTGLSGGVGNVMGLSGGQGLQARTFIQVVLHLIHPPGLLIAGGHGDRAAVLTDGDTTRAAPRQRLPREFSQPIQEAKHGPVATCWCRLTTANSRHLINLFM